MSLKIKVLLLALAALAQLPEFLAHAVLTGS